jgi:hypothetical protein
MTIRVLLTLAATLLCGTGLAQPAGDTSDESRGNNPWGNRGTRNWGGQSTNAPRNPWANAHRWPAYGHRWPSPWGWRRPQFSGPTGPNPHAWGQPDRTESGFVIINGKEIEPPFEMARKDGKILVNGHEICKATAKPARQPPGPGMGPWAMGGQSPPVEEVFTTLLDGGMVIVVDRSHYILAADAAAKAVEILISERSRKSKLKKLGKLPGNAANVPWASLVDTFQPSAGLEERLDRAAAVVHATSGCYRRLRRTLLIIGLALAILALGFLVLYRPASHGQMRPPALLSRTVLVSILLLIAMNIYDLVATMQSCIPGGVMEMNRLAHPLIRTPLMICAAKLGAVGAGCLAIWWFREHKIASFAAWWLGLAYTVLTFHWAVCQYILLA